MSGTQTSQHWRWLAIGMAVTMMALPLCSAAEEWEPEWEPFGSLPSGTSTDDITALASDPSTNGVFTWENVLMVTQQGRIMRRDISGAITQESSGVSTSLWDASCATWGCVVAGQDTVKYSIGSGWVDLVNTDGAGNQYMPVWWGRSGRVYFGWLGLGPADFDYVCEQEPGEIDGNCRAITSGPVVAFFDAGDGDGVIGFTQSGSVYRWSADLLEETVLVDPSPQYVDFRDIEYCNQKYYALERLWEGGGWGLKKVSFLDDIWTPYAEVPFEGDATSFAFDPSSATGVCNPRSFTVGGSDGGSGGEIWSTLDGGENWEEEVLDSALNYPVWAMIGVSGGSSGPPMIVVGGENGTILKRSARSFISADGFEEGNLNAWSSSPD